jgi:hypothetical protein
MGLQLMSDISLILCRQLNFAWHLSLLWTHYPSSVIDTRSRKKLVYFDTLNGDRAKDLYCMMSALSFIPKTKALNLS